MKYSQLFGKSSKSQGTDLKIKSHRLLVQAGYIRESVAGRYYLLPLGQRVQNKIIRIVRKHMDKAGAQEMVAPTLHPLELWQETNRDNAAGFELMQVKDRRGAEFALGGTAEEMFVDVVRKFNISYKELPFNVYQFGLKFRDEFRARGGLLRVREFLMKDAYSFSTEAQFEEVYQIMSQAYSNVFEELGLQTKVVEADSGYIGGDYCHEFIVDAEVGESAYLVDDSGYIAHEDVAKIGLKPQNNDEKIKDIKTVEAVRETTMVAGAKVHNLPLWQQIKDVLYVNEAKDLYILAVIRGDLDVNETKLMSGLGLHDLRSATEQEIRQDLESEPGFISPVGFKKQGIKSKRKVVIVGDPSLRTVFNAYGGANQLNQDLLNVNIDRDYKLDEEFDIALARDGDLSVNDKNLSLKKGIEVGNIFQLGYHYSDLMQGAEFTNQDGKKQKYYMGCYGIGIGRTLAAIAEIYADDNGLNWPASVAPFDVYLAVIGDDQNIESTVEDVLEELELSQIEVLHDDRGLRPGEQFANADLLGMPVRIVVSQRSIEAGGVEIKHRASQESKIVAIEELVAAVKQLLDN